MDEIIVASGRNNSEILTLSYSNSHTNQCELEVSVVNYYTGRFYRAYHYNNLQH